jgi:hypothetical protein
MKIRSMGAELSHVDGRTDMKLLVAFRNFPKAPENERKPRSGSVIPQSVT